MVNAECTRAATPRRTPRSGTVHTAAVRILPAAMQKHLAFGLAATLVFFGSSVVNPQSQISNPPSFPTFTDIAAQAGLTHPSVYGDAEKKRYIIETNGCGTAFYDYDNDGWMDLLVLSGTRLEQSKEDAPTNR